MACHISTWVQTGVDSDTRCTPYICSIHSSRETSHILMQDGLDSQPCLPLRFFELYPCFLSFFAFLLSTLVLCFYLDFLFVNADTYHDVYWTYIVWH